MTSHGAWAIDLPHWQRRVRLVVLLAASERAGFGPMPVRDLHMLAYLVNVLAPAWDLPPLDGKVLKRREGVIYPQLQQDLDGLVGDGVVRVHDVSHVRDLEGHWQLVGAYELESSVSRPIVEAIRRF